MTKTKLERLTAEQEAMLPAFRDFGLQMGLSTERTDRVAADMAIRAHYRACGLAEPEIRWFDSPWASVGASVGASVRASVWDSVGASVRDSVRASVWASAGASVGASVRDSVWDSVGASVRASVWDSVGASVRASARASVGASVRDSVRASVGASVGASVRASVRAGVRASVGASVRDSVGASVGASVRASVGAHYDADEAAWAHAWDQLGIRLPAKAMTFIEVNKHVWWYNPGEKIVFASDRPTAIRRDDAGRLHSEAGMAIEFADGRGLSAWHGQTIPDDWVNGKPPSPAEALHWPNMDQRAAACEIVGWHNILDQLDARTINDSGDPLWGRLVEVSLPDSGRERFLDAICGTGRRFALPVPPDTASVDQAQSVLHGGLPPEILRFSVERT